MIFAILADFSTVIAASEPAEAVRERFLPPEVPIGPLHDVLSPLSEPPSDEEDPLGGPVKEDPDGTPGELMPAAVFTADGADSSAAREAADSRSAVQCQMIHVVVCV